MSGYDVGVGADDIVAAGAGKLGADARLGSEVPNLHGSVVAAADHLKKLHHFMVT
jgi:hypothetical protein